MNLAALRKREPDSPALGKYAKVAELLTRRCYSDARMAGDALVALLREWLLRLGLPQLSAFGMEQAHIHKVIANCRGGSMQTNPLVVTDEELKALLCKRL